MALTLVIEDRARARQRLGTLEALQVMLNAQNLEFIRLTDHRLELNIGHIMRRLSFNGELDLVRSLNIIEVRAHDNALMGLDVLNLSPLWQIDLAIVG